VPLHRNRNHTMDILDSLTAVEMVANEFADLAFVVRDTELVPEYHDCELLFDIAELVLDLIAELLEAGVEIRV
jgi:hypothetical protein